MTWLTRLRTEEAGHDRSGRDVDELTGPLIFRSERYGDLLMPVGFRTNYCSIPRAPVIYWFAGGKARKPGVLHDLCYTLHALLIVDFYDHASYVNPRRVAISRQQADDLFLEALEKEPLVSEWMAGAMHKAVSWFGQSSWEDDTNILQTPDIRELMPA